jgi:hypothetical protein
MSAGFRVATFHLLGTLTARLFHPYTNARFLLEHADRSKRYYR